MSRIISRKGVNNRSFRPDVKNQINKTKQASSVATSNDTCTTSTNDIMLH